MVTKLLNSIEVSRVQEITQLHNEIGGYLKMSLEKAIRIGELLVQQKASMKHGGFTAWIEANLSFTDRTARNYMRLFRQRDEIKTENVSDLSVTGGYRMLTAPLADLKISKRESKREEEGKRIEYAKTHPEEVPVGDISHGLTPGGWKYQETITGEIAGFPLVRTDCIDPNYLMLKDMESPWRLEHELKQVCYGLHTIEGDINRCLKKYKDQIEKAYWTDFSRGICTTQPELTQALSDIALILKKFSKCFKEDGVEYRKFEGMEENGELILGEKVAEDAGDGCGRSGWTTWGAEA
ncbi:hypothetical protein ES703_41556 [subsurface metagenome]